jgi:hypothetical protein
MTAHDLSNERLWAVIDRPYNRNSLMMVVVTGF